MNNYSPNTIRMHQRAIIMTIILFVLIVLGMFVFAFLKQNEIAQKSADISPETPIVNSYETITRVDAKHYFIDGVHTLVGEIAMPTPCDLLESNLTVAESFPEQIRIDFTVLNNSDFCTQVVTQQRFKVSVEASEDAIFTAYFQGKLIELNLIDALEGETPDEFELFIKG